MDKRKILLVLIAGMCLSSLAQKPSGYFGKRNSIGYEFTYRPFGKYDFVERVGGGLGKLKLERIITKNRVIGINIEKVKFLVNEPFSIYYLHNMTMAVYIKKFNHKKAIVPIGRYHAWSLENSRNYISLEKNEKQKAKINSMFLGFDLGKAFPVISRRMVFNVSAGLRLRLYKTIETPSGWGVPLDINEFIYERCMAKIEFGISYAF